MTAKIVENEFWPQRNKYSLIGYYLPLAGFCISFDSGGRVLSPTCPGKCLLVTAPNTQEKPLSRWTGLRITGWHTPLATMTMGKPCIFCSERSLPLFASKVDIIHHVPSFLFEIYLSEILNPVKFLKYFDFLENVILRNNHSRISLNLCLRLDVNNVRENYRPLPRIHSSKSGFVEIGSNCWRIFYMIFT